MITESNYSRLIVLGTAQLGLDYGVANRTGKPNLKAARDIVRTAWEGGIRYFDTAQAYGESERVLGNVLSDLGIGNQSRIITKLSPTIDHANRKSLEDALSRSLDNLKCNKIYGLMLHREDFLDLFEAGLAEILEAFVNQGLVEKIGVSFYTPIKAQKAFDLAIINILQVPANMCDRRFHEAGIFNMAEENESDIFIRSVFLQGLLLMDKSTIPQEMCFASPIIDKVEQLCLEFNMTRQELALNYVRQKYPQAFVVIGAETQRQVKANLAAWNLLKEESITERIDETFKNVDERIINPTLWPRLNL